MCRARSSASASRIAQRSARPCGPGLASLARGAFHAAAISPNGTSPCSDRRSVRQMEPPRFQLARASRRVERRAIQARRDPDRRRMGRPASHRDRAPDKSQVSGHRHHGRMPKRHRAEIDGERLARKPDARPLGDEIRVARTSAGLAPARRGLRGGDVTRAIRTDRAWPAPAPVRSIRRAERGSPWASDTAAGCIPAAIRYATPASCGSSSGSSASCRRSRASIARSPLPIPGDRRAWDALVASGGRRAGCEAETHLGDIQALERKLALKLRDGAVDSDPARRGRHGATTARCSAGTGRSLRDAPATRQRRTSAGRSATDRLPSASGLVIV